ncbi:hypothetical protein TNCV_1411151 [Trichonephila clavipes]|nr:hypothetical protein TNCV_1411151 [Trichonephila clavipes]
MFFEGTCHDDNVVKVHQEGLVRKSSEDCSHKALECCSSPAAHLCFSSKSVLCRKSLTRSLEERPWLLYFQSTQVTEAQVAITSPSWIVLVLLPMLATLTVMIDFERFTTEEAISTPAFELSGSG